MNFSRYGDKTDSVSNKFHVLPYKTGTSFYYVSIDSNIPFKLYSSLFDLYYLASMSSITALGLSKPDVMRLNLYDPSNRDTSILLV